MRHVRIELPLLLPEIPDARDACVRRLQELLTLRRGITRTHVVDDGDTPSLCLHYDPATTNVARIRDLAEAGGARLTEQFGHVLWPVTGIGHARKARAVAESRPTLRTSFV